MSASPNSFSAVMAENKKQAVQIRKLQAELASLRGNKAPKTTGPEKKV